MHSNRFSGYFVLPLSILLIGFTVSADPGDQLLKLLADDGAMVDYFGYSVAISGNTIVVGANGDDDNGERSGSAYVFDVTTGEQICKLVPDDGAPHDEFGSCVAVSGTTAIVGAYDDDDYGESSGSAYIFDTRTGQQIAKLLPSDGMSLAQFGWSVAIDRETAMVGALWDEYGDGAVYVFHRNRDGRWIERGKLVSSNQSHSEFGTSVALSGTTAVIGAPHTGSSNRGAAEVWRFDGAQWKESLVFEPDGLGRWFLLGYSVALSGSTAVAGAPATSSSGDHAGYAYVFDVVTGEQIARLTPEDGHEEDSFGQSVSLYGHMLVVGAPGADGVGEDSGAAYLFDTKSGELITKIVPNDSAEDDRLGFSVATQGGLVVVGAYGDDDRGPGSGSAYVFEGSSDCLVLTVDHLVEGEVSQLEIGGGTPGARTAVFWGFGGEPTTFVDVNGWCATFGFDVRMKGSRIRVMASGLFNDSGVFRHRFYVRKGSGLTLQFQAAERGTCPDECMSSVVEDVVR